MPLNPPEIGPGHRITTWHADGAGVVQVSVCCLDSIWEPVCEVTEAVGPFDDVEQVIAIATDRAHRLGGWRAHQLELL